MISAQDALQRLREGNRRFVENRRRRIGGDHRERLAEIAEGQNPFAIILGCSDSRVPAEIVFDQGLGDLFVIRVAGNIVAPSQVGSVEFAAASFGCPLVVVMGHSRCGAVMQTLQQLKGEGGELSKNLRSIVSRIAPALEELRSAATDKDPEALLEAAIRANVRASADHLRHGSAIVEDLVASSKLIVVGAEYSLDSGEVDFFDAD